MFLVAEPGPSRFSLSLLFAFSISFAIDSLVFSFSPSRTSDPGALLPPLYYTRLAFLIREESSQAFLPAPTRVAFEQCHRYGHGSARGASPALQILL